MNTKRQSVTSILIGVITGAYVLGSGINIFGTQLVQAVFPTLPDHLALFWGGQYSNGYFPGVATGEWYRLLTVALTHASVLHLFSNMYCLYIFGPILERYFGKVRFIALFIISLVGASAFSVYFGAHNQYAVGASGAIFGLLSGLLVIGKRVGLNYQSIVGTVVLNVVITFSIPGIDWRAHAGGFVAGAIASYFLMFSKRT
jgi:membrane associated rhomboid family serine protease